MRRNAKKCGTHNPSPPATVRAVMLMAGEHSVVIGATGPGQRGLRSGCEAGDVANVCLLGCGSGLFHRPMLRAVAPAAHWMSWKGSPP